MENGIESPELRKEKAPTEGRGFQQGMKDLRGGRELGVELVWFEAGGADELARALDAIATANVRALLRPP